MNAVCLFISLSTTSLIIFQKLKRRQDESDLALLEGSTIKASSKISEEELNDKDRPFAPSLVIVPPSVIENWSNEFKTWGHFSVAVFQDKDRALALERIRNGMDDIMICGRSIFIQNDSFEVVKNIRWKLIVIDEFHEYKNGKSQSYEKLEELRNTSHSPLMGLTGTVMPNKHKEMWTLVNLVQAGVLGSWKSFNTYISRPIMLARCVFQSTSIHSRGFYLLTIIYSSLVESFIVYLFLK